MDPLHVRGHAALRRGRCSLPHHAYLVTFATEGRQRHFARAELAMAAAAALADPRSWRTSELWAWVLMPDHWHGLVMVGRGDSLSRAIQRAKAHSARRVRLIDPRLRVWAPGFHDHAIRREEDLVSVARYVVGNPVRAGLVGRCGLYPYWDARWV